MLQCGVSNMGDIKLKQSYLFVVTATNCYLKYSLFGILNSLKKFQSSYITFQAFSFIKSFLPVLGNSDVFILTL